MCVSASAVLIKPATPAAASKCPMFVLTDPIAQKPDLSVSCRYALVRAAISIGSPRKVPVPCASTYEIVSAVTAALALAEKTADTGDTATLRAAVDADADDHQARYDLALALYAAGQKEDAIEHLVEIVRRDREWNDRSARNQLLQFFEALGPTDPLCVDGRRKLSARVLDRYQIPKKADRFSNR